MINVKLNIQNLPPHLSNMAPAPARFSSFVEVVQKEEDEFVWGAMAELEKEVKNIKGLVMTQVQEKTEIVKRTDKNKKAVNKMIVSKGRRQ